MNELPWERWEGSAFRDSLNDYKLANHPFKTHPFYQRLERGEVAARVVHRWVQQFYPWLMSVPIAYAERYARAGWQPEFAPYRKMILDQLVEEAGDPKGNEPGHPELWLRFCEGLGLSRASVESTPLLPSTMVAIDDFLYLNREAPFYVSAAGSSEPPNVELCARLGPAFKRHYGVADQHLRYFELHVKADEEHSKFVNGMVADFAKTPQIRREMWNAMLRGFALHQLLMEGAIVEPNGSG